MVLVSCSFHALVRSSCVDAAVLSGTGGRWKSGLLTNVSSSSPSRM